MKTTKDLLNEIEKFNDNQYNKNLFFNLLLDKNSKLERLNDILKEVDEINEFMEKFKIIENLNNSIFDIKDVIESNNTKYTKNDLLLQISEIVNTAIKINGLEKLNKDCGCKYDDVQKFYEDENKLDSFIDKFEEEDKDYDYLDEDEDEEYY